MADARFETLFVEFDDPRPFALQARLRDELRRNEGYVLHPHLRSLLYRGGLAVDTAPQALTSMRVPQARRRSMTTASRRSPSRQTQACTQP